MAGMHHLRSLSLAFNDITRLPSLPNLSCLESLDIVGTGIRWGACVPTLPLLPHSCLPSMRCWHAFAHPVAPHCPAASSLWRASPASQGCASRPAARMPRRGLRSWSNCRPCSAWRCSAAAGPPAQQRCGAPCLACRWHPMLPTQANRTAVAEGSGGAPSARICQPVCEKERCASLFSQSLSCRW